MPLWKSVALRSNFIRPDKSDGKRVLPAMSVPLGMSSDRLPIDSHFVAESGNEKTLFELAYKLEQAQPWAGWWAPNSVKAKAV